MKYKIEIDELQLNNLLQIEEFLTSEIYSSGNDYVDENILNDLMVINAELCKIREDLKPLIFKDKKSLIEHLRKEGDEEYNKASDEYIFNEAESLGWFEYIERGKYRIVTDEEINDGYWNANDHSKKPLSRHNKKYNYVNLHELGFSDSGPESWEIVSYDDINGGYEGFESWRDPESNKVYSFSCTNSSSPRFNTNSSTSDSICNS